MTPQKRRHILLIIASSTLAFAGMKALAQLPDDAVSREISVFNDQDNPVDFLDAVSREISVFNDLDNPVIIGDAISREMSVFPVIPL